MSTWWVLWLIFMFMFLLMPVGYGWGYRGWGPPYPRYIQRRRGLRAVSMGDPRGSYHQSWGWGGDLVWMVFTIGLFWVLFALWWR